MKEEKTYKLKATALAKEINLKKRIEKTFTSIDLKRNLKKESSSKNHPQKIEKILILDSIRSVQNVGAIFRTADAIGIDKIYLTGYCPTPQDRFGRVRSDFQKASLDAEVKWEYKEDIFELCQKLKKEKTFLISIEQDEKSVDYKKVSQEISQRSFLEESSEENQKIAVIMGNENYGVKKEVLKISNTIAELPMYGFKNSLNVAVTTGIILYSFFDNYFIEK